MTKQPTMSKSSGDSARADKTRQALLEAAIQLFASDGYTGVSNRKIADLSGANQALIGYHFGNKEGLYLGTFEYMVEKIEQHVGQAAVATLAEVQVLSEALSKGSLPKGEITQRSINALVLVMNSYCQFLLAPESQNYAKLIMQEQQNPTQAFDIFWNKFQAKKVGLLTQLVALTKGRLEPEEADKLMIMTLIGQILIFRIGQSTVIRQMGWEEQGVNEHMDLIKAQIEDNIRKLLG